MKIYSRNEIDKLADILKKDDVICVPTDTVYGVCARMNSEKAYDNLMNLKKRPGSKMFPIMCADKEQIKSIAKVDERAEKLIDSLMPGPVTIILNKKDNVPGYVNNNGPTIAFRMATSKPLEDLIKKVDSPIFMSSANQSGKPQCTNLNEIIESFPELSGMMEGNVTFGKSSTIIDCTSEEIKILREGPISLEQINKIVENAHTNE